MGIEVREGVAFGWVLRGSAGTVVVGKESGVAGWLGCVIWECGWLGSCDLEFAGFGQWVCGCKGLGIWGIGGVWTEVMRQ